MGVSAIIPTYNRKHELKNCLRSLLAQTKKPDEIIVIDDNSSDGTGEMVRKEFPSVRLIKHEKNKGTCAAFNTGIKNAKYEYVAMFDHDVVLPKTWIEKMVGEIEKDENVAIVSGRHVPPNYKSEETEGKKLVSAYYDCGFNGGANLARKSALLKTDLYSEKFFIYVNEEDLAAKLLNKGYKIKQYPSIISYHHGESYVAASRKAYFKKRIYFKTRNKFWHVWKHYPLRHVLFLTPFYLFFHLILALEQKAAGEFIKGTLDAFKEIDYAIKNREVCKEILKLRRVGVGDLGIR